MDKIDGLRGQELELAVVEARIGAVERSEYRPFEGALMTHVWKGGSGPFQYNYVNDIDAVLLLLVETGWVIEFTHYADAWRAWLSIASCDVRLSANGETLAEAGLRCWLKWHNSSIDTASKIR